VEELEPGAQTAGVEKLLGKLGVMAYAYNLGPWEADAKGGESEARLGYIATSCLKDKSLLGGILSLGSTWGPGAG
jgi:hypothetical protein